MADDAAALTRTAVDTWFNFEPPYAVPWRSWSTGEVAPMPVQDLVRELQAGDVAVKDHDQRMLLPFRAAARLRTRLTPDIENLLCAIAAIYTYGASMPDADVATLEDVLSRVDGPTVLALTGDDSWTSNYLMSLWEFVHGETELTTYPWNISLPIADICNARCTFCTAWIDGKALVKLSQLEAFTDVIRRAVYIGLVGHGEPLAHPQFDKICELIGREMDPRAKTYTITNGVYLKKWEHLLDQVKLQSFSISLNAATPETHHAVMGLGEDALPGILDSLRKLCERDENGLPKRNVSITLVVTQQNLHEIPAFIRLGEDLRVGQVWLRSLLPQTNLTPGLNYHLLPAYLHPDYERLKDEALAAIAAAKVPVIADPATWGTPVFPPKLQAEIDASPPVVVQREQALRDKELRQRTAEVYTPQAFQRRGRKLPMDDFSRVEFVDGRTRIETKTGAWQYAVSMRVPVPADMSGAARIAISVSDVAGKVGLGLWDEEKKSWVDRAFLEADGDATLNFEAPNDNLTFVVENGSTEGRSSHGLLDNPRLIVGGREAGGLDLTRATIHGSVDPFEDGLNPLGRQARFACKAVYYNLYVNEMYFRVVPCCYMTHVAGFEEIRFDGSAPFMDVWNAPAMVELRRRLKEGPLFGACRKCPEKW